MTRRAFALLIAGFLSSGIATAHELDQYIQAAIVQIEETRVSVQLRLTPGIEVFPQVSSKIDANHDGKVSTAEESAYGEEILKDFSLVVDGKQVPLTIAKALFSPMAELKSGNSSILFELAAPFRMTTGKHTLAFSNRHMPEIAAYSMNCWEAPAGMAITNQSRSENQNKFEITVEPVSPPSLGGATALVIGGVALAALGFATLLRLKKRSGV